MPTEQQEMQSELLEYDGYLILDVSPDTVSAIREAFIEKGLGVDVGPRWLEFNYQGRDSNRWVVGLLRKLAQLIECAEGEITCTLVTDFGDPTFEFYSIADGKLCMQSGQIVRSPKTIVD